MNKYNYSKTQSSNSCSGIMDSSQSSDALAALASLMAPVSEEHKELNKSGPDYHDTYLGDVYFQAALALLQSDVGCHLFFTLLIIIL